MLLCTIICDCFENRSTDFRLLYHFGNGIPIPKALLRRIFEFLHFLTKKAQKKAQKWWISNGRHFSACMLPIFYCCGFLEIGHQGRDTDDCRFLIFDFFHSQKKPQKSPKMKDFKWQAFLCLYVTDFSLLWLFRNLISMPQYWLLPIFDFWLFS